MPFTSINFLVFVAIAVIAYYLVPQRFKWIALLLASYVFYMAGGWRMVFYILFTTAVTYSAGVALGGLNARLAGLPKGSSDNIRIKKWKKCVAAAALMLCFGLLFIFRYWNFAVAAFTSSDRFMLNLIIPLGVSFYIFQSVGYVIDVYRGKHQPERNPAKYALFVSFFPQIIQGPIGRFHHLAPQLTAGAALDWTNIKYGIQLAIWGYFKKLVIADRAGIAVNEIFDNIGIQGGTVTAFAVFLYSIQLYCDFSGGIDITRGVAKMLGIEMAENFRRPLFATSLADFWRRWHITLGAWLKDYLFFSLALSKPLVRIGQFTRKRVGGTLGKIIPTSICTFTVYFAIGIWHGASFRFIAFGLWNGVIITSSLLLAGVYDAVKKRLYIKDDAKWWWVFSILRTSFIVFLGRYMTRAPRFTYGVTMLWRTFTDFRPGALVDGTLLGFGLNGFDMWVIFFATIAVIGLEYYQECGGKMRQALEKRGFWMQWAAIVVPLAAIVFLGLWGQTEQFIYGQF